MKVKLPVAPFLYSLLMLLCADLLFVLAHRAWPLVMATTTYFLYCSYREIWHNGHPLVLYPRRK